MQTVILLLQVVTSVVLVGLAALMVETLSRERRRVDGFRPVDLIVFHVSAPAFGPGLISEVERQTLRAAQIVEVAGGRHSRTVRTILEAVSRLPGVDAVATTSKLPLSGGTPTRLRVVGAAGGIGVQANMLGVSNEYFEAIGAKLTAGRGFERLDDVRETDVAVIDEDLERALGYSGNPIGSRISIAGTPPREVIGVVQHLRLGGDADRAARGQVYVLASKPVQGVLRPIFLVRTERDIAEILGPLRRVLREVDSSVVPYGVQTGVDLVRRTELPSSARVVAFGFAGLCCLVVTCVGSFGLSYRWASARRTELRIRSALGASQQSMVRLVSRRFLFTVCAGTAMGLLIARALSALLRGAVGTFLVETPELPLIAPVLTGSLIAFCGLVAVYLALRHLPTSFR